MNKIAIVLLVLLLIGVVALVWPGGNRLVFDIVVALILALLLLGVAA